MKQGALQIRRLAAAAFTGLVLSQLTISAAWGDEGDQSRVPIEIVTAHLPPWSIQDKGSQQGVLMDLVKMLGEKAGLSDRQYVTVFPWKRAQVYASNRENVLILPMMRTKVREKKYGWLQKVDHLSTLFVTADGTSLDLEEAKKVGLVTVRLGTPMEDFLVRNDFQNLLISPSLQAQLTMLKKGRVQAWFVSEPLARYTVGIDQGKQLTFGPSITSSPVYLATSLDFPEEVAKRYQDAYADLQRDGAISELWQRYIGREPNLE